MADGKKNETFKIRMVAKKGAAPACLTFVVEGKAVKALTVDQQTFLANFFNTVEASFVSVDCDKSCDDNFVPLGNGNPVKKASAAKKAKPAARKKKVD